MANPIGTEILTVLGVQPNGQPAATTENFTLAQVSAADAQQPGGITSAVNTSADTIVNTTGLVAVPGLALNNLVASGIYSVIAAIPVATSASVGIQLALAGTNGLTATSANYTGSFNTASTSASVQTTTFGGGVGTTLAVNLIELNGVVQVNAGGSIVLQAAQNVASSATTTLLANGYLQVTRVS